MMGNQMTKTEQTTLALANSQVSKNLTLETLTSESGMDSLDMVSFIMDCEIQFNVELPDPELDKCKIIGDIANLIKTTKGE